LDEKNQHCLEKSLISENPVSGLTTHLGILVQMLFSHHYHDITDYNIPTD